MAAQAVAEELTRRGHRADILDPYTLAGTDMDRKVGNCYVKCVQRMPELFGCIYRLGNLYRHLPGKSPVYYANRKLADHLQEYLYQHSCDVIFTTHLFPGEILTHLKKRGVSLPPVIFISTDYTCIPFTEETECDYFIIPSPILKEEFCLWGIAPEKVIPIGIPVRQDFREEMDREKAVERLGLNAQERYILLAGGSIGAGKILEALRILQGYLQTHRETVLIVICGTNKKLYETIKNEYKNESQILLLKKTECMAEYLKVCDFYISKPGGISSTEAAVSNIPLIHISPIPGCETKNAGFFSKYGMSIGVSNLKRELLQTMQQLTDNETVLNMKKAQHDMVDRFAAEKIVMFTEKTVSA